MHLTFALSGHTDAKPPCPVPPALRGQLLPDRSELPLLERPSPVCALWGPLQGPVAFPHHTPKSPRDCHKGNHGA